MATRSSSPLDAHTPPTSASQTSGKATASFVVGILAVIGAFTISALGLILGIVAVAMGQTARKTSAGWQATAGFWLGVVAIVAAIVLMVLAGVILASKS